MNKPEEKEVEVAEEKEVEQEETPLEAAPAVQDDQPEKQEMAEIVAPAVRPTTLMLERTTLQEPEYLSPLSPVTKPVSRIESY